MVFKRTKPYFLFIFFLCNSLLYSQPFIQNTTIIGLPNLGNTKFFFGDIDNDKDLDILISGTDSNNDYITKLFLNHTNGIFTDISLPVPAAIINGDAAFCDINHDGYLDFIITGETELPNVKKVTYCYRNNTDKTFSRMNTGIDSVSKSTTKWFDYDRDGDLDLFLAGETNISNGLGGYISTTKIYLNNRNFSFSAITTSGIPSFSSGDASIVDFNQDNLKDIIIMGVDNNNQRITEIYYQDYVGKFSPQGFGLLRMANGDVEVGDYDQDGDIDISVSGRTSPSQYFTKIYQNINGLSMLDVVPNLTGVINGTSKWIDFDHDGDLDMAICGDDGNIINGRSVHLYQNQGNNVFTTISHPITPIFDGDLNFMDYDLDGDLDAFLSGFGPSNRITQLYKNTITNVNTIPSAPVITTKQISEDSVKLNWNYAFDDHTNNLSLSYNCWITTNKQTFSISSPQSHSTTGFHFLRQDGFYTTTTTGWIKNLSVGKYYYKINAIDNNQMGSSYSFIDSFTICKSVRLGKDTAICKQKTIALQAGSGTDIVQWYSEINNTSALGFIYTQTITGTDTISVRLQNIFGCVLKDTIIAKMNPLPVKISPSDIDICFNQTFQLFQNSTSDIVQWKYNNGLSSLTGRTFTGIAKKKDTIYVELQTSFFCTNKDTIRIDTLKLPRFNLGIDTSVCKGQQSIAFSVTGVNIINWSSPTSILGQNVSFIQFDTLLSPKTLFAEAIAPNTCRWKDTINIAINSIPTVNAGIDTTICHGFTYTLGGQNTGSGGAGGYTFEWSPRSLIPTFVSANPITSTLTNSQLFVVTITDALLCFDLDSILVKVNPVTTINSGIDREICLYDKTMLGGIPTAKNSRYPYTYYWYDFENYSSTVPNPLVSPPTTTTYRLIVTTSINKYECKPDTGFVKITVNPLPVPYTDPFDADTTVGFQEDVQLKAFGGISYEWSNASLLSNVMIQTPIFISPTANELFVVTVTDNKGCKQKDSIHVFVKTELFVPSLFSPNNDQSNDFFTIHGTGIKEFTLTVFDRYGQLIYDSGLVSELKSSAWQGWDGKKDGIDISQGNYQWTISGMFYSGESINKKGAITLIR
ncbi:MAG: hypothetical protein EAZ07_09340 [Cytophagales bacterium]|nr:MAG: hypothetical protein EAZ07_09340 [Cytophagales bacterium]